MVNIIIYLYYVAKLFRLGDGLTYDFLVIWSAILIYIALRTLSNNLIVASVLVWLTIRIAFAVNVITDIKEDSFDPMGHEKNILVNEKWFIKHAKIIILLCILGTISLALIFLNKLALLAFLIQLYLCITYSYPPRWKTKPPSDLISHGIFFGCGIPLIMLIESGITITISILLTLTAIFFFSTSFELSNHIRDYYSDLKAGLRTSATVLGLQASIQLTQGFIILGTLLLSLSMAILHPEYTPLLVIQTGSLISLMRYRRSLYTRYSSVILAILLIEFCLLYSY